MTRYATGSSLTTLSNHLRVEHQIESLNPKTAAKRTSNITKISHEIETAAERKSTLARRLALMVVTDLLPFSIVNGAGFRAFAFQEQIVADINELPVDRTLANSALNDLFVICQEAVKQKLKTSPSVISLQLDMSTSTNGNIPLITIVVAFIDDNFTLQSFSLSTEFFERPHTGDAIAKMVHNKLAENDLSEKKIFMSGDHGKNVKKSFEKIQNTLTYFDCIGHSIHLDLMIDIKKHNDWKLAEPVMIKIRKAHGKLCYQLYKLKDLYDSSQRTDLINYLKECEESIEAYKADEESPIFEFADSDIEEIMGQEYLNFTSTQQNFSCFKLANATRWYSTFEMIKSYYKNFGIDNFTS